MADDPIQQTSRSWLIVLGTVAISGTLLWVFVPVGGTSCVARGSRIRTPGGWTGVEDLSVGDEVLSVEEGTGELVRNRIVATRSARRECGCITVGDQTLELTSDHPVLDPNTGGYHPAGDWFLGRRFDVCRLAGDSAGEQTITRARTFVGLREVFDLSLAHAPHNFVAESIVVHNKSPLPWAGICPSRDDCLAMLHDLEAEAAANDGDDFREVMLRHRSMRKARELRGALGNAAPPSEVLDYDEFEVSWTDYREALSEERAAISALISDGNKKAARRRLEAMREVVPEHDKWGSRKWVDATLRSLDD